MKHFKVRRGALKGGREVLTVDEEELIDDGKGVNGYGEVLDGDEMALCVNRRRKGV